MTITESWGILRGNGYHYQYEDGWFCTHLGEVLVGRAVTAMFMPHRPQMCTIMEEMGAEP